MYSFFILCEVGSEKDGIGKNGLAHVLEHFVILAMLKDFFTEKESNLRGQTSYCYCLYSWSNAKYQVGLNLIFEFENFVRRILNNKNEYYGLMLMAIREVEEEILSKHNGGTKINVMIHVLNNDIVSRPIGLLEDIKSLNVDQLFETFGSIYVAENLRYFIFNHEKNEFVFSDLPQKITPKVCVEKQKFHIKELGRIAANLNIDIQIFKIFGDNHKKIALSSTYFSKIFNKEQTILNELFLISICKLLDKAYAVKNNCKFEIIFFSHEDSTRVYYIFELMSSNDIYEAPIKATVDVEQIINLMLESVNFHELKEELRINVYNNRFSPISRSECEAEILNVVYFNNFQVIKDYEDFNDVLQNVTIDKFKRFLYFALGEIDNLIFFE
ncbi:hypothetical protein G9G63_26310 [Paenibacillus sp. EKM202P]|uniref:hypothetical protein n=1 Tax=unclassified Paenibacillus TaxID=185978 RepID=UPI0013ED15BC|nr:MULTISPECIES: hypothetical protein [unclassified Paenibacillus]KAF6557419.1 hypothetical protein G9G63_26310 [Paenibacillus sp. EKM202P]KAF6562932.1 hypothetical protein G9G64_26270 [Paenibacillus sp. EKM207P]